MQLTIIIVNFRSPGLIIDCLRSVYEQPESSLLAFEVIVVDNNSNDNSKELILGNFPHVHWIQMNANSGFARANNEGIREAKGNVILLLNPDTINLNNAIGKCFESFSNDDYMACGIQLLNPDRSPQISGSYFIKGGLNQLMALPYLGRFIRGLGYAVKVKKTSLTEAKGVVDVDWINGAFLMVKKEAIEKAGLMDEDFFLYFEEIEWCSRVQKIGRMCIYGDLNVVHLQGTTTNEVFGSTGQGYYNLYDRKGMQIMVSALLRIRKQYGRGWFLFHLLAYCFTVPIFFIGLLFTFPFNHRSYTFRQFSGYVKNCIRLISLSGRIMLNRPYFYKVL